MKLIKMFAVSVGIIVFSACTHKSSEITNSNERMPSAGVGDVGSVDISRRCSRPDIVLPQYSAEDAKIAKEICVDWFSRGVPEGLVLACFNSGPGWGTVSGCPDNWAKFDKRGRKTYLQPSLKTVQKCNTFQAQENVKCENLGKQYPDIKAAGCRGIYDDEYYHDERNLNGKQKSLCKNLRACAWDKINGSIFFSCLRNELNNQQ